MSVIGQGISLRGMTHNDFHYPFYLNAAIVAADVGKPVSLDTAGPNRVKIAGDGDHIIGKLTSFEDRKVEGVKVGTIELRGGFRFPILAADTLAVGDTAVGAGDGFVKKAATAHHSANFVVEVSAGHAIVVI